MQLGNKNCKIIVHTQNGDIEYEDYNVFIDDMMKSNPKTASDIVFDNADFNRLSSKLTQLAKKNQNITMSRKSDDTNSDIEQSTPTGLNRIGVTKFLSGLKVDDVLLFPEFIEGNYWNERHKDWIKGEFRKEEIEVLFPDGNINPNINFTDAENKIREKWKAQAEIGTNIHSVLEQFFKYSKSPIWKNKNDESCVKLIKSKLGNSIKDFNNDTLLSLVKIGRELVQKFGEDALYFPEFKISGETQITDANGNVQVLVGSIDLLVLDAKGFIHVLDYKTSPLGYLDYDSAKHRTFDYQLATYNRLLANNGIVNASVYVAPIRLEELRKTNGKWGINNVSFNEVKELTSPLDERIQSNISKLLPPIIVMDDTPEDLAQGLNNFKTNFFGSFVEESEPSIEEIENRVEKEAKFNSSTGKWVMKVGTKTLSKETKEELVVEVRDFYNYRLDFRFQWAMVLKKELINSIESTSTENFREINYPDINKNSDWINNYLSKYQNPNWEVLKGNDITDYHGVILLRNQNSHQIDILTVNYTDLGASLNLPRGKFITGFIQSDIKEESKGNSQILDGTVANMELLKAVEIANRMSGMFDGYSVGEVAVINPREGRAISAPNEQLKYNYDLFRQLKPDIFTPKTVNFATSYSICENKFKEILTFPHLDSKWSEFKASDILSSTSTVNFDKRTQLRKLKEQLEKTFPYLKHSLDLNTSFKDKPERLLYKYILDAISETSGIHLLQIYKDGDNYLEDVKSITDIFTKGIYGLEIDNPGNLKDKNLNLVTQMIMRSFQNVRDRLQLKIPKVRKAIQKFKDAKGYTTLKERTVGNPASLYTNMVEMRDGNLFVKNPWDYSNNLRSEEREFLEFFLFEINRNRMPETTVSQVKENSNHKYFQLPLMKGDMKTDLAVSGVVDAFKHKMKSLSLSNIIRTTRDENQEINSEYLFEIGTSFDIGEGNGRLNYISERTAELGEGYFEHNLETLLLAHMYSYATKDAINEVFPDIEAIMFHLKYSAFIGNTEYENSTNYIQNLIKSKIFHKNIDDAKWDEFTAYSKQIMKVASYLALAFNPKQVYQFIEGIWKDILIATRSIVNEDERFTFTNLRDSFLSTLPEMIHYGQNGRTKWEALNQIYAINDMGIDEFVDKIKTDRHGMWGFFDRIAFHFASRPDFYNRATIFGAQMRKDGCWDAYEWEDGTLTYNFAKDKRFDRFAANDKSDLQLYNQQKALYLTMARQMELDHTVDQNGNLFRMLDENGNYNPLPKAYTVQQSESLKDVADSIYGYYSTEKKSMIQAHTMGAMIMQMNTYWSAKKNQYLAPGSVKLQGELKIVEGLYLDENGEITETNTGVPYMRWEGDFQEGIFVTISQLFRLDGDWHKRFKMMWDNEDENLRRAYRNSFHQFTYDLIMWLFFGQCIAGGLQNSARTYIKENDDPFTNLTVDFAANVFKQSFVDYSFFGLEAIFGRGTQWTPFSLTTADLIFNNYTKVLSGDMKAQTAILNTFGATRNLKPYFKTIEQNEN